MKILMIGATGQFAGLVLPHLKKLNMIVRAVVQSENKGIDAVKNGADEYVIASLYNKDSLVAAAQGVQSVFHINPAFQREIEAGLNMVNAAREAGVNKFVFSSVYHPSLSLVNHADKRPVEEALYLSKMDYTILQPAMYMQMLRQTWASALKTGEITGPYSKYSKMSYVDYNEVAECAALAFVDDRLSFGTFELSSDGMYSRMDLASLIGKTLDKPIVAHDINTDYWAKVNKIPDDELRNGLIAMNKEYDDFGFSGGNSLILDTILGRKAKTVPEFIQELNF